MQHPKSMSRLQRSIDAPHRRILTQLEERWSAEEDRAIIKKQCPPCPQHMPVFLNDCMRLYLAVPLNPVVSRAAPMVRLSRGMSASRQIMLDSLGARTAVTKDFARNFAHTHTPPFSLDDPADCNSFRIPGLALSREYHLEGEVRQLKLRYSPPSSGSRACQLSWGIFPQCCSADECESRVQDEGARAGIPRAPGQSHGD